MKKIIIQLSDRLYWEAVVHSKTGKLGHFYQILAYLSRKSQAEIRTVRYSLVMKEVSL